MHHNQIDCFLYVKGNYDWLDGEMSFNKDKYETVYTGEELKDNYTIIQDDGSGKYEYLY